MRIWWMVACVGILAGWAPARAQETTALPDSLTAAARDSLTALLAEAPLDSVLAQLGDSLFVPAPGRVRILRDRFGVPHIYGRTDTDVAFGFGYAQAQDHLIPMLLSYRAAQGRLAEVLGPAYVESDTRALLWRIHSGAGEEYGSLPKSTLDLIGAFVDGINAYMDIHRPALPSWAEPVRGTDVVALSQWLNLLFAEKTGRPELAQIGMRPLLRTEGADVWAVGAPRSAHPLLAMDVQLPWQVPMRTYEAHLVSQTGLDVAGGTFFGLPVIVWGHNDRIAWSLASSDADMFDLYEEKLDASNSTRYLYEQETHRMTSRQVKIRVRVGSGVQVVQRELLYTDHGPVYKVVENRAYAARTPVVDQANSIGQLYTMDRAGDLKTFRAALSQMQLPGFHVVYADADGSIFYGLNAACPVRPEPFDWRAAVPGWTGQTEWKGLLPFDRLPEITNPASGFLQNCNVPPPLVTVDTVLDSSAFPPELMRGRFNNRAQRAMNWLFAHPRISVADMRGLIRDEYLISAEELKGLVLAAYNRNWSDLFDPNGQVARAAYLLRSWDDRATADSRATLLFATWKERFAPLVEGLSRDQRQNVGVLRNLALEALRMSVAYLRATYGRVDVPWGQVHVFERGGKRFPVGGSPNGTEALHRTWSRTDSTGLREVTGGSAFTMVVSLGDTVRAWSLLPYGESEHPDSPHFSDQALLQAGETLRPAWFSKSEVRENLTSVLTVPLTPEEARRERLRTVWRLREKAARGAPQGAGPGTVDGP